MNRFNQTFLVLGIAMAMSSCARMNSTLTKTSPSTSAQPGDGLPLAVVSQASIEGNWTSACTTGVENGGPVYTTVKMTIENATPSGATTSTNTITTDTIFYAEATCESPLTEELRIASFNLVLTDVNTLQETLASIQVRPLNSVIANDQNQSKYCGITNWTANAYQSIVPADVGNCAGLVASSAPHSKLYGAKELYLDDCASDTDTNCSRTRFIRAAD
jgi:hypothetical protein